MFCAPCIRKWLVRSVDSQCPHCRRSLAEGNIVNCRWADEVVERLDDVQQQQQRYPGVGGEQDDGVRLDWCAKHQAELTVHCETCQEGLCYHAALWGETHAGHTFRNLRDVYNQRVDLIRNQLPHLRERQQELLKLMQGLCPCLPD